MGWGTFLCGVRAPRSLSDIDRSTAANDLRPSASCSARKNPQRIPVNTPPVFPGLRPCIWPHLLRLVTKAMADRLLARMIHEHFCCNRRSAALGREASSMRETSFVKRISFRSRTLHVSHLLPALHASRDTPFDGLRASRACRGTLHSLLRFTRNAFSWRFRPSTVLGTLSFVEGPRTVMNHAG